MSQEENEYAVALTNLDQHDDEFKEAFQKHAKDGGQIPMDTIVDLINDISVILAIDCEAATKFFTSKTQNVPKGLNLVAFKYDSFMDIFKQWLKKEAGLNYKDEPKEKKKGILAEPQINKSPSKGTTVHFNQPVQNYNNNRKLLDSLLHKNQEKLEEMYKERLFEEGQQKVNIQDCFVVLQEWFYLDTIDLKEHRTDSDDFFRNLGSFKRYFTLIEKFLVSEKKIEKGSFDVREVELSLEEILELLDFWLRTDPDVILVDTNTVSEEGAVRKMLLETIEKYEAMAAAANTEVEAQVLEATIASLREKLAQLDRGSVENPQDQELSEAEKRRRLILRDKAFKEIFAFYCTQQLNTGRTATFDRVGRLTNTINLGTYTVLLKNFKLKYDHIKLLELYKKAAGQDENLDYQEFDDLMNKVAMRAEMITEIKTHEPKPEIMKDYKPDSYKNDQTYRQFKKQDDKRREEASASIIKNAKDAYAHQVKRNESTVEKVWEHMGLYDGTYKHNIGFVQLPFNSHDKQNFRIPPGSLNYKFRARAMEGKTLDEIKEEVVKRNELRRLIKDLKGMEKSMVSNYRQTNSLERSTNLNSSRDMKEESTYTKRQGQKVRGHGVNDMNKLTLKKIEALLYGDIKKVDEKFNPGDLIDENDEEDNMYLAEYNLHAEKKRMKASDDAEKKKLDTYGKLKKPARGFAQNGKYGHQSYSQSPPPHSQYQNQQYQNQGLYMDLQTDPSTYYMDHVSSAPSAYGGTYSTKNGPSYNNPGIPVKKSIASTKNLRNPTYLDYGGSMVGSGSPGSYSNNAGSTIGYNGYNGGNNPSSIGYSGVKNSGYNNAMGRAGQIEQEAYRKEQQMISSVMNIQNNQIKKGMRAVGK